MGLGIKKIALAGNPNVGKSTVFNALTGLNQHTGNWPGKTVAVAEGRCFFDEEEYILVDLPGTYSLMANSAEEEVARDFLIYGGADVAIVVCDATCLERNLNLALQTMEITPNVVICVNLMDEAEKKGIKIDLSMLEKELGVPVAATSARSGRGLDGLMKKVRDVAENQISVSPRKIRYPAAVEQAVSILEPKLRSRISGGIDSRWIALRLLERDNSLFEKVRQHLGYDPLDTEVGASLEQAHNLLDIEGITVGTLRDRIVSSVVLAAEEVCAETIPYGCGGDCGRDRKLDKILTGKRTGIPIMLALLCGVLWLTITGANYPSQLLSDGLFWLQDRLMELFIRIGAPEWLTGMLILGAYRVLAWVISVMLPPMAIFFPLFTLLEDFGYLPRVAFNLDHQFKKASACGKQALTMCMGFGCNAAGVVGCRIIDSPRERLIAILTNNFVPCNGRFPTLIAIISMFFMGSATGVFQSLLSTLMLMGVIVLGVAMTFITSRLLSVTLLKGEPSSFTLELPPYRAPQFGKVLVRSLLDRTLFVLGRAAVVAAPAGLVIWVLANVTVGETSLLRYISGFLDPFARLLGLDGIILLAFILGFPANEIVVPIIIMSYMSTGSILELESLSELKSLLVANGWTWVTAVSAMLFCLIHWPCSTTCLTIAKETNNFKWTALSVIIPTVMGMTACLIFASAARLLTGL